MIKLLYQFKSVKKTEREVFKMKRTKVIMSLVLSLSMILSMITAPAYAEVTEAQLYTEPDSPSEVYNLNIDWKYKMPDMIYDSSGNRVYQNLANASALVEVNGKQFYDVDYDDSGWETVSIPHQVNASDSFTTLGSNQGDTGQFRGIVLYRKHFTVPKDAAGKKLFVEFE